MRAGARAGLSTLVAVLVLLAVLAVAGTSQQVLSRQARSDVHRVQLATLARTQARSAIQELHAAVGRDLNEPGTPLFRKIREVLDEDFGSLDLSALVRPPTGTMRPAWGLEGTEGARAQGRVLAWSVRLEAARPSRDVGGSEEWAALVTLSATAEMADAAAAVRRQVDEIYELRTVLAGPPRPFDQVGLFLGDAAALSDPAAVNAARARLLAEQEKLRLGLGLAAQAPLAPEEQRTLEAIAAGILPAAEASARTPMLPEEPAVTTGFYHVPAFRLEALALAALVRDREAEVARHLAEVRATAGAGGKPMVDAVYGLADALSRALTLIWEYQLVTRTLPESSETHRKSIAPYLPRLTPEYFLDRAFLAVRAGDPVLVRWLSGRDRLDGVIDASGLGQRLELTGELRGRTVLLVGPAGARLRDLGARASRGDHRLTVVSLGGDVEVSGGAHAAVIMLPAPGAGPAGVGRVRIPARAHLTGALILPHATAASLHLEGRLSYDERFLAAHPPARTLEKSGAGDYVVALSPVPLVADGKVR